MYNTFFWSFIAFVIWSNWFWFSIILLSGKLLQIILIIIALVLNLYVQIVN